MPECEICGDTVSSVYTCENCEARFCRDCGSPSERLCADCKEFLQEEEDDDE